MVLVHRSLAVASCSVCLASAFVGSPFAHITTTADRFKAAGDDSFSRVSTGPAVAPQQFNPPASRREAVPPLLLSSRTVDVDVIDVTDVTEEEARREKEQVIVCIHSRL